MTVMVPQYFWWRGCCFAALNVHPNAARGQACILPMVTHRMRPGCGPDVVRMRRFAECDGVFRRHSFWYAK
jgi:hypothetical protein